MSRLPVSLRHLERLTDDTGLLEHCLGMIPRRKEGYTTDDNARALWACVEWLHWLSPTSAEDPEAKTLLRLIDTYLSFLLWVQRDDGTFHNNIAYNRTPEPEHPSDDCLGRVLWASAVAAVRLKERERRLVAEEMFTRGIEHSMSMTYPRGWAYALAACCFLLEHAQPIQEDSQRWYRLIHDTLPVYVNVLETRLCEQYRQTEQKGWHWFEPVMTYGNGLLPWGLFWAYRVNRNKETLDIAQTSLTFLIEKMTAPKGWIRPIGNRDWCAIGYRSAWDQQPLDVMKLALACAEAYQTLGKEEYLYVLRKCRDWFYGENDWGTPLVNREEGSCCDGLTFEGVNLNQGAESTISYLLTEAIYAHVQLEVDAYVCYR